MVMAGRSPLSPAAGQSVASVTVMSMRPSFFMGPSTCATLGLNALPSMAPVTLGAGWNVPPAAGALSEGAAEAAGAGAAAAGAGAADGADSADAAGASSFEAPFHSSEELSALDLAGGSEPPPQAASRREVTEAMTTRARMQISLKGRRSLPHGDSLRAKILEPRRVEEQEWRRQRAGGRRHRMDV